MDLAEDLTQKESNELKTWNKENTHMVIRVTTKDWTKHKDLNTKKRAGHEDRIPKVFDYMSDQDYG